MSTLETLFIPHTARSSCFEDYEFGEVAFVTNGLRDNGVLGFVRPKPRDKVFDFMGIALSAFCEATVQTPPFIGRGNGGSGLVVLEPQIPMTASQLAWAAAYINVALRWRFSWYRQASVQRIRRLPIPALPHAPKPFVLTNLVPSTLAHDSDIPAGPFARFPLDTIYNMEAGDYHNASNLPVGATPLVSCGDANNGIMRLVSVPPRYVYDHKLTIAFNGDTLTAKYHPYAFAAKDDVAVCFPRTPLRMSTEIFIQVMLNRERWRYSYYRKCFIEKLRRFEVYLPHASGSIDENRIERIVGSSPYWDFVTRYLEPGGDRV